MSDFQIMTEMLAKANVVFSIEPAEARTTIPHHQSIRVGAYDGPNNYGYTGFWSVMFFDAEGNLVGVGAWE